MNSLRFGIEKVSKEGRVSFTENVYPFDRPWVCFDVSCKSGTATRHKSQSDLATALEELNLLVRGAESD